jgi:hypothetical protein
MHEARVVAADYAAKTVTLDKPFPPAVLDGAFFEVGSPPRDGHEAHWTTFEAAKVSPREGQTTIQWRKGADVFSGLATGLQPDPQAKDRTVVALAMAPNLAPGENAQLVMTADGRPGAWRCDVTTKPDYSGANAIGGTLTVYDRPIGPGELKAGDRIRLWEFGAGDLWRTPSKVSLRRTGEGLYELQANTPCRITLTGGAAEWSADGKTWRKLAADAAGKVVWQVGPDTLGAGRCQLRWTKTP